MNATFHSWQNDGRLRAYSEAQRDVPRSAYVHLASAARPEENAHGEYLDVGDHSVDRDGSCLVVRQALGQGGVVFSCSALSLAEAVGAGL